MTFTLSPKTKILWQMRVALAFILICTIVAFFSKYTLWFLLPTAVIATAGFVFAFVYIPLYFKSYKITVNDNSIVITKGIIIKSTNIMPYPRLVFAQSFTTPLSEIMNLKCVMLKAARGWMLIPEMDRKSADYLLDNLKVMPND